MMIFMSDDHGSIFDDSRSKFDDSWSIIHDCKLYSKLWAHKLTTQEALITILIFCNTDH
jgi:hypothetical protein